jgi:hypothetical protein
VIKTNNMSNQETEKPAGTDTQGPAPKTVKAIPSSPIYAMFDLVEIEGKQMVTGSIGFKDQWGMERMARAAGAQGIENFGKHVLAIYAGQVDIIEPDDATKAQLTQALADEAKAQVVAGELKPEGVIEPAAEAEIIPFSPEASK